MISTSDESYDPHARMHDSFPRVDSGTQSASNDVPVLPISPSVVPEQSPNLNILKSLQNAPPKPMPGTDYQSHPYWKNR